MRTIATPGTAALSASALAGPLFLLSMVGADIYTSLPRPVPVDQAVLTQFLIILVPAAIIGFILAIGPNLIGTTLLSTVGADSALLREPIAWTGTGALLGAGLAFLFGAFPDNPNVAFALILTSAVCARICRIGVEWND